MFPYRKLPNFKQLLNKQVQLEKGDRLSASVATKRERPVPLLTRGDVLAFETRKRNKQRLIEKRRSRSVFVDPQFLQRTPW